MDISNEVIALPRVRPYRTPPDLLLLFVPDPVISADMNNDFRVSFQEYISQADRKFSELDTHHDTMIRLDEWLKTCRAKK